MVVVGRILRSHGIRGEVAIQVMSDVADRFSIGAVLTAVDREGQRTPLTVSSLRPHRGGVLAGFRGIGDRTAADPLKGQYLEVESSTVPPPEEGTYYYFQLIGCRCVDEKGGELGRVVGLLEDGGGLLLMVEDEAKHQVPIPFVNQFLAKVDIEAQLIELQLPEGLLEICSTGGSKGGR